MIKNHARRHSIPHDLSQIVDNLIQWAEQKDSIRAMLLTSTRAIPNAPVDRLSDYDVVLIVKDIHPFYEDRNWLNDFGEVWSPTGKTKSMSLRGRSLTLVPNF